MDDEAGVLVGWSINTVGGGLKRIGADERDGGGGNDDDNL